MYGLLWWFTRLHVSSVTPPVSQMDAGKEPKSPFDHVPYPARPRVELREPLAGFGSAVMALPHGCKPCWHSYIIVAHIPTGIIIVSPHCTPGLFFIYRTIDTNTG